MADTLTPPWTDADLASLARGRPTPVFRPPRNRDDLLPLVVLGCVFPVIWGFVHAPLSPAAVRSALAALRTGSAARELSVNQAAPHATSQPPEASHPDESHPPLVRWAQRKIHHVWSGPHPWPLHLFPGAALVAILATASFVASRLYSPPAGLITATCLAGSAPMLSLMAESAESAGTVALGTVGWMLAWGSTVSRGVVPRALLLAATCACVAAAVSLGGLPGHLVVLLIVPPLLRGAFLQRSPEQATAAVEEMPDEIGRPVPALPASWLRIEPWMRLGVPCLGWAAGILAGGEDWSELPRRMVQAAAGPGRSGGEAVFFSWQVAPMLAAASLGVVAAGFRMRPARRKSLASLGAPAGTGLELRAQPGDVSRDRTLLMTWFLAAVGCWLPAHSAEAQALVCLLAVATTWLLASGLLAVIRREMRLWIGVAWSVFYASVLLWLAAGWTALLVAPLLAIGAAWAWKRSAGWEMRQLQLAGLSILTALVLAATCGISLAPTRTDEERMLVNVASDLNAVPTVEQVLVVADSKLPIRLEYVLRSRWPRAEYRVISRTSDAAAQLAATAVVEGIVVIWEQSAVERIVPVSDLLELQPIIAPRTYGDGILTVLRSAARPASGTEDSATRAGEAG